MMFTRIDAKEMRQYVSFPVSDLYLDTVVTYLEAGGLYPGWLGRKRALYVYDATLDPEDYFNSYREIRFEDAVKEALGTCECFETHLRDKLSRSRKNSLEYADCLHKLGRVKGDLIVLKMQNKLQKAV